MNSNLKVEAKTGNNNLAGGGSGLKVPDSTRSGR